MSTEVAVKARLMSAYAHGWRQVEDGTLPQPVPAVGPAAAAPPSDAAARPAAAEGHGAPAAPPGRALEEQLAGEDGALEVLALMRSVDQ